MNDPITQELLRTRALFAISYAIARYTPIPLVDDFVRERLARSVLERSAAARGHVLEKDAISPLASSSSGCLGCLMSVLWIPIKIILFPIRTILSLVLGVRWASRDLIEILALGRTLDRLIADGRYPIASSTDVQATFAREARRAFDRAMKGLDTEAVTGVLKTALGPLRALVPAAIRVMRRTSPAEAPASADASASRIVAALDEPQMRALFEKIDARFDQALLEIRAASAAP